MPSSAPRLFPAVSSRYKRHTVDTPLYGVITRIFPRTLTGSMTLSTATSCRQGEQRLLVNHRVGEKIHVLGTRSTRSSPMLRTSSRSGSGFSFRTGADGFADGGRQGLGPMLEAVEGARFDRRPCRYWPSPDPDEKLLPS